LLFSFLYIVSEELEAVLHCQYILLKHRHAKFHMIARNFNLARRVRAHRYIA